MNYAKNIYQKQLINWFLLYYSMYIEKRVDLEEIKGFIENEETDYLYMYLSSIIEAEGLAHIIVKELYYRYDDSEEFISDLYKEYKDFKRNPAILFKALGKTDSLILLESIPLYQIEIFIKYQNSNQVLEIYFRKLLKEYVHPKTAKLQKTEELQKYSNLFEKLDLSLINKDLLLSLLRKGALKNILSEVDKRTTLNLFIGIELSVVYKYVKDYNINLYDIDRFPSDEYVKIYATSIINKNKLYVSIYEELLGQNTQAVIFSDTAMERGDKELKLSIIESWYYSVYNADAFVPPFDEDSFNHLLNLSKTNDTRISLYAQKALKTRNIKELAKVLRIVHGKYDYTFLLDLKTLTLVNTLLNNQV